MSIVKNQNFILHNLSLLFIRAYFEFLLFLIAYFAIYDTKMLKKKYVFDVFLAESNLSFNTYILLKIIHKSSHIYCYKFDS